MARDADLFICECYFYEKPVRFHLINARRSELGAKLLILTHLGPEMLRHKHLIPEECAYDGLVVSMNAGWILHVSPRHHALCGRFRSAALDYRDPCRAAKRQGEGQEAWPPQNSRGRHSDSPPARSGTLLAKNREGNGSLCQNLP